MRPSLSFFYWSTAGSNGWARIIFTVTVIMTREGRSQVDWPLSFLRLFKADLTHLIAIHNLRRAILGFFKYSVGDGIKCFRKSIGNTRENLGNLRLIVEVARANVCHSLQCSQPPSIKYLWREFVNRTQMEDGQTSNSDHFILQLPQLLISTVLDTYHGARKSRSIQNNRL